MIEGEPQGEDLTSAMGFEDMLERVPEEKRDEQWDQMKTLAGVKHRAYEKDPLGTGDLFADFFDELKINAARDNNVDPRKQCKLYHLLAGSSMMADEADRLPWDTPSGDCQRFIEVLQPLADAQGE